jgi:NADH-quinone oxidoreductase subunit H
VLIVLAISTAFESSKKKRDSVVHPEAAEPSFAVPSLPSEITTINVSNQGGDRG